MKASALSGAFARLWIGSGLPRAEPMRVHRSLIAMALMVRRCWSGQVRFSLVGLMVALCA